MTTKEIRREIRNGCARYTKMVLVTEVEEEEEK